MDADTNRSSRASNRSPRTPWIIVSAVIIAAVLLGIALIVGNTVFLIVAAILVVLTVVAAAVVPRKVGRPISFTEEFPQNTVGPRATTGGDSTPPINTQKHSDPMLPGIPIHEADGPEAPEPPDDERVFPQYVNLAPEDRLRRENGATYVEKRGATRPEDEDREPK